jgi:hypothetical protein
MICVNKTGRRRHATKFHAELSDSNTSDCRRALMIASRVYSLCATGNSTSCDAAPNTDIFVSCLYRPCAPVEMHQKR